MKINCLAQNIFANCAPLNDQKTILIRNSTVIVANIFRSLTCFPYVLLLLAFSSCSSEDSSQRNSIIRLNESTGLQSLDPALAGYRSAIWIGSQIFNGLVESDSLLNLRPAIAKSWTFDSSGTIVVFTLRRDVYFHDNSCFGKQRTRTVSASDVKYSFERICNAATRSTGFWVFRDNVVGAKEYGEQTKNGNSNSGVAGIAVVNDSVVSIRLTKPFAPFISLLSTPYCWIVPREAVELYKTDFGRNPVGTGSFSFVEWKDEISLKLKKNSRYFKKSEQGEQLPYLDEVHISFVRNAKSEFLEFEQKKIDILASVDPAFAEQVFTRDGRLREPYKMYNTLRTDAQSIEYYGFLLDTSAAAAKNMPFCKDKRLRQALNYAVDRDKIIRYVLKGKGIAASNGVLPPSIPGFNPNIRGYDYNVQKAKKLLAESGFPNGKGLPKLVLQIGANETVASVAESVVEYWKEIGVEAEIVQVDFPRHLGMVRNGELSLWRTSWIADYPDPENFLALFYSKNIAPSGPNTTRIARQDLDSLYREALDSRLSQSRRFAAYNAMENIIVEESPWIFLFYNVNQWLVQPEISGLHVSDPLRLPLEYVRKKVAM